MDKAHYIINFIVYTFAMVGILVIAYVVYKKTVLLNPLKKNSLLSIIDMMRLPDRKMLYIIKCRKEQFLIASSNDKVTLISKLEQKNEDIEKYLSEKKEVEDYSPIEEVEQTPTPQNRQIMKSLLKELSDKNQFKRGNY